MPRGPTANRHQWGIALPAVLLILVALTLLAHGAMYLSRQELAVARASAKELAARLAAEAGARRASAGPLPATHELTGTLDERARYVAEIRFLGPELAVVTSRGTVDGWTGTRTVARLLWIPDPPSRIATFRAAVEAGGPVSVSGGSEVDATDPAMVPPGWEGFCSTVGAGADTLFPTGLEAVGPLPSEPPGHDAVDPVTLLGLGPVAPATLRARADLRLEGDVIDPLPYCTGETAENAQPSDEGSCPGGLPLVFGDGSVRISAEGEGRGVLVVRGDLELAEGATFTGLVLVTGRLRMGGDARIRGLVRALDGASLDGRSAVTASACAPLAALASFPGLARPLPLATGAWLDLP